MFRKLTSWLKSLFTEVKSDDSGAVSIAGILMMGLAMVFIGIGFIFLPISTTAVTNLMNYVYSGNASITDATYTGYTAVLGITPLLVLVGYLTASVITGFLGIRTMKGEGGSALNPGSLILLGLSLVFVAIGLIFEPVALDGISGTLSNGGVGIDADFTGYESILKIAPMLLHIGYLTASVIFGFFGIRSMGKGAN